MAERKRKERSRPPRASVPPRTSAPPELDVPVPPSVVAAGMVPPGTEVAIPPVVHRLPSLTRGTLETLETEALVFRRPGDHWRERLAIYWRPTGPCLVCQRPRVLLASCAGEAAPCDLHHVLALLREQEACVCSYDDLET